MEETIQGEKGIIFPKYMCPSLNVILIIIIKVHIPLKTPLLFSPPLLPVTTHPQGGIPVLISNSID